MRKFVLYLLVAFTLLPCGNTHAQLLPIRNYTTRQGLNANSIEAILRDSRGMLWVGTYNGLNLYDGARFLQPAMTTRSGQIYVTCLMEDSHRQVWAATWYSGLYKYSGGIFTNYLPDTVNLSDQRNNITAIVQLDDSTFLAGTDQNALLFDGRTFSLLDPANTLLAQQIHSLVKTPRGDVLVGLPQGLAWYRKTPVPPKTPPQQTDRPSQTAGSPQKGRASHWKYMGLLLSGTNINHMASAGDHVWITSSRGLLYYPSVDSALAKSAAGTAGTTGPQNAAETAEAAPITLVSEPVDNVFSLAGSGLQSDTAADCWYTQPDHGASLIHDGKTVQLLNRDNGLPSSFVKAICTDVEGITWLGTDYGLAKLTPAGYRFYPVAQDSGREANIISIARDATTTFLGTYNGLYRMQDHKTREIKQPNGASFGYVFAMLTDKHNRLWVCASAGLFCRDAAGAHETSVASRENSIFQKLSATTITAVSEDPTGTLWFGSLDGHIYKTASQGLSDLGVPNNLKERITALHADGQGALWVGYYQSGLYKFKLAPDSLQQEQAYTAKNGYSKLLVRSIGTIPGGQLLVGTRTGGLYFFNPIAPPVTREQGLSGNWVKSIYIGSKNVYLATNNGLDRLNSIDKPDSDAPPAVSHISFNQDLIPAELNSLLVYNDTFWLGTSRGVLEYIPGKQKPDSVPPPVYGMRVVINGRVDSSFVPFTEKDSLRNLDYTRNNISFDFAALSFRDEDNVRYRYKLEGVDAEWSQPTDRRYVNYGDLPPGSYRFLVTATNGDGVRSSRMAAIGFTIAAPFWRTTWFLLLCTVALIAAVYGFYRFRLHQLLRVEKLRHRISTDLHDDIGSTLSSISILSDMAIQEEEVRNGPFAHPADPAVIPPNPDHAAVPRPANHPAGSPAPPTTLRLMIK